MPVLYPAARRKLLDRASTPADPRAHRATRVAPDVIESDGPWWSTPGHAARVSLRREAVSGSPWNLRNQRRWRLENSPCREHEWPDRDRQAPRGPFNSPKREENMVHIANPGSRLKHGVEPAAALWQPKYLRVVWLLLS